MTKVVLFLFCGLLSCLYADARTSVRWSYQGVVQRSNMDLKVEVEENVLFISSGNAQDFVQIQVMDRNGVLLLLQDANVISGKAKISLPLPKGDYTLMIKTRSNTFIGDFTITNKQ